MYSQIPIRALLVYVLWIYVSYQVLDFKEKKTTHLIINYFA